MRNTSKRLLSLLLALVLVLPYAPTNIFAVEQENIPTTQIEASVQEVPSETDTEPEGPHEAKIGDEKFDTLPQAIEAANAMENGATITLLKNVTLGQKLTVTGHVTLDGDGYTITRGKKADGAWYTGTLFAVSAGAELTLDGGLTIDGGNKWTHKEINGQKAFIYVAENYVEFTGYDDLTYFVSAEANAPVTNQDMITVGGALVINEVTIKNHWGLNACGIMHVYSTGSVTMNAKATITHNVSDGKGTVVTMDTNSRFVMNGGEMSWNVAEWHGGCVENNGGYMTMNSGSISYNFTTDGMGSTIFIYDVRNHSLIEAPNFYMTGGEISYNISLPGTKGNKNGSAIYYRNGIMTMTGGSIHHNMGRNYAGICANANALTVTGGSIVDNVDLRGLNTTHDLGANHATLMGGVYTQDISQWCAEGYYAFKVASNQWEVAKGWEVTFQDENGNVLQHGPVREGQIPVFEGEIEPRDGYVWAWDRELAPVTETATYRLVWTIDKSAFIAYNVQDDLYFDDLSDALDVADPGETVQLLNTWYEDLLSVPAGITLDLNGNVVKTTFLRSFGIVMDSQLEVGGIEIDSTAFAKLNSENGGYLPIYDTRDGQYKFFKHELTNAGVKAENNVAKFGIRLIFENPLAYEVLANTDNSCVDLIAVLKWTNISVESLKYYISQETIKEYALLKAAAPEKNYAITLKIYGLDHLTTGDFITVNPAVVSKTEVNSQSQTIEYILQ